MRIAVPIADGRISPVFDVARRLRLVDIEAGNELCRDEVSIEETELAPRAQRLASFNPQVLICGAISQPLEALIRAMGVDVIPQTCGRVDDVLRAYLSDGLADHSFEMPGCRRRRQRSRVRGMQNHPVR
jgi:predicted Fe-Mo cluster-binding NifX family protein